MQLCKVTVKLIVTMVVLCTIKWNWENIVLGTILCTYLVYFKIEIHRLPAPFCEYLASRVNVCLVRGKTFFDLWCHVLVSFTQIFPKAFPVILLTELRLYEYPGFFCLWDHAFATVFAYILLGPADIDRGWMLSTVRAVRSEPRWPFCT